MSVQEQAAGRDVTHALSAAVTSAGRARATAAAAILCTTLILLGIPAARGNDPNALWTIVHDQCVPEEEEHGDPKPCAMVDLNESVEKGYVVLKDLRGATQFLLMPTARITGIESPVLLAPDAANYFADAWQARTYVEELAHRTLPREDISLAVNSMVARTQNQLHIHIDCVRADVRDALQQHEAAIGETWVRLDVPLAGHHYMAMRVAGEQLGQANPFKLLADGLPGAKENMGQQTLVVVGASFADGRPGFIILSDHADPATGDRGGGEELQDHACAVAQS